MKHSSYLSALLLALVSIAAAQEKTAGDLGKAKLGKAPAIRAAVSTSESLSSSTMRQVLARELTIFPGTTVYLEWLTDLSGSERVGISVTTLSDPYSRLSNVRIGVAFAAPGDWYIVGDVILGGTF